jgi:prepilin-type N-terminal cleavage/methylation domain-containing protein
MNARPSSFCGSAAHDRGFSRIEFMLVLVLLGILSTIVVTSVDEFKADAENVSCTAEASALRTAVDAFLLTNATDTIPPTQPAVDSGDADNGVELTLIGAGFLRSVSSYYDLDVHGDLVKVSGSPCIP